MDLEKVHKTFRIFARVAVVDRWVVGSEEFSQHNRQSSLVKTRWTDRESNRLGGDSRHGRRNSIVLEMYMIAVFSVYHRTLDAMDNSEYVAKGGAEVTTSRTSSGTSSGTAPRTSTGTAPRTSTGTAPRTSMRSSMAARMSTGILLRMSLRKRTQIRQSCNVM